MGHAEKVCMDGNRGGWEPNDEGVYETVDLHVQLVLPCI
jgi:hypothetical protein